MESPESKKSKTTQYLIIAVLIMAAFYLGTNVTNFNGKKNEQKNGTVKTDNSANNNGKTDVMALAEKYSLNKDEFSNCLYSDEISTRLTGEEASGGNIGITGTPGVVLYNQKTGKGILLPGAYPLEDVVGSADALRAGTQNSYIETLNKKYQSQGFESGIALVGSDVVAPVTEADYITGNREAEIFLIEYSDYECPYCQKFGATAKSAVNGSDGKIAWVYRQLVVHPTAEIKSRAALCAGKMGGNDIFWKFTEEFFN